MEIRPITEAEKEQSFYLGSQAFMNGSRDTSWYEDPNRPDVRAFGVWDEAGLQAQVVVIDYKVHLGPEVVMPMGGIAGVACLPASRGKGYAGACLKYALAQMREAGQYVSTLFPFSWDYYRRLGWEWVGEKRLYAVASKVFQSAPETENVGAAAPEDRAAIVQVYTRFAGRYRGMLARTEKHWNSLLDDTEKEHTFTYLFTHAGEPEGYLTYRGGTNEDTRLREFLCLTPRARRGLQGLLRRHAMQIDKIRWSAPSDDGFWQARYHWDIETRTQPCTQGRVVDVEGALRAWKPGSQARGAVTFAVRDECAPWNEGMWRAEYEGGQVLVRRSEAAPQVSLDIQAFSQAYFGTPTIDSLRAAERLTVHDEAGYAALRGLLDGPPMWMNDSF